MDNAFVFDSSAAKKLEGMAETKGLSQPDVLKRAVAVYEYLMEQEEDGVVVLKKSNGTLIEIVL